MADHTAHHLGNLLAVIHRDGGQYQRDHGDDKATGDAIVAVARLRSEHRDLLKACESAAIGLHFVVTDILASGGASYPAAMRALAALNVAIAKAAGDHH